MIFKTYHSKAKEVRRDWHLVDAKGKILGRMATDIARFLIGKGKAKYSPHMDIGDYVVVINADKVELTGKKKSQKVYFRHSGYPGGFKEIKFVKMLKERPERIVELAVSGMLPKNRLHQKRMRRLKIFAGSKHPYEGKIKVTN